MNRNTRLRVAFAFAAAMFGATSVPASALTSVKPYPQSYPAAESVQAQCMTCKAKCRKCTGNGGDYTNLQDCYDNCNNIGNPRSVSTCGVRKGC